MVNSSDPETSTGLEGTGRTRALTGDVGRLLSSSTKSRPFLTTRTPRWILRAFEACGANVAVQGGVYQVNRVQDGAAGMLVASRGVGIGDHSPGSAASHGQPEGDVVDTWIGLYDPAPKEISLEAIQAIVRTTTRVPALFSDKHDQTQWQFNTIAEVMYETKEDLVFNHPDHGLLRNVHPSMDVDVDGPPSLDLLDDLLTRAWKRPDCFVMHPEALAVIRKEATARSLRLEDAELFGSSFSIWRGLPIFPSDKLRLAPGSPTSTTDVLLLRMGMEEQGVVCLSAADATPHPSLPSISVEFMGLSDEAIASYLLTTYCAVAVLSPGALARAHVKI